MVFIFLDLSKEFDTLSHQILMDELQHMGARGIFVFFSGKLLFMSWDYFMGIGEALFPQAYYEWNTCKTDLLTYCFENNGFHENIYSVPILES